MRAALPTAAGLTVDELLAFHRATFGAARMEGDSDAGGSDDSGKSDGDDGKSDDKADDGKDAAAEAARKAKAAETAKRAAERKVADLEARLAKIDEANKSEGEKALEAAKREGEKAGRDAVLDTVSVRLRDAAVTAYATGKLADPSDAVALAELDDVKVDPETLEVDDAAVRKAVDDLLKRKPHLAGKRNPGTADGGARPPASDSDVTPGVGRLARAYASTSSR